MQRVHFVVCCYQLLSQVYSWVHLFPAIPFISKKHAFTLISFTSLPCCNEMKTLKWLMYSLVPPLNNC